MAKSVSKKSKVTPGQFKLQMGKCLVAWQGLEGQLFDLFWTATKMPNQTVCAAVFSVIRNISTKGDLADAAIKASLSTKLIKMPRGTGIMTTKDNTDLLNKWASLHSRIGRNSSKRNKIAHNDLIKYISKKDGFNELVLMPHFYKSTGTLDPGILQKEIITYDDLKKAEKESKEITKEISQFTEELEVTLAKESSS